MDTLDDPERYANNSGLCGNQIDVPCQRDSPSMESPSIIAEEQWFSWEAAGIGYPFGVLLTFVVGYIIAYSKIPRI